MKRLIRIITFLLIVISLLFSFATAELGVYSDRCLIIKQAERAIQEEYKIVPEMYTFFVRKVTESENGTITVTLTGQDCYYWVLGTYTGSSDGKDTTASWSNEGKQTYGGFDAPAWDALQLHQMIDLTRKEHTVASFYPQAVLIASRDDPDFSESHEDDLSLINEHLFELTVPHPDHQTIEEKSEFTKEQLDEIAISAVSDTYLLYTDQVAKICVVDSEPNFRYEIRNGELFYRAWLQLQQSTELDSAGYMQSTEHDGEYLVIINAETGDVEDIVYDSKLNGNG